MFSFGTVVSWVWTNPMTKSRAADSQLRGVASLYPISPMGSEIEALRNTVEEINIGCLNKVSRGPIHVLGRQVRIVGKFCELEESMEFTKVLNKKNGIEGTTFQSEDRTQISTDYMYILQGRNELEFEYKESLSEASDTVVIVLHRNVSP